MPAALSSPFDTLETTFQPLTGRPEPLAIDGRRLGHGLLVRSSSVREPGALLVHPSITAAFQRVVLDQLIHRAPRVVAGGSSGLPAYGCPGSVTLQPSPSRPMPGPRARWKPIYRRDITPRSPDHDQSLPDSSRGCPRWRVLPMGPVQRPAPRGHRMTAHLLSVGWAADTCFLAALSGPLGSFTDSSCISRIRSACDRQGPAYR
jgi:hypothetical protein